MPWRPSSGFTQIESVRWRGDMTSVLVGFRIASLIIGVHREFSKSVIE